MRWARAASPFLSLLSLIVALATFAWVAGAERERWSIVEASAGPFPLSPGGAAPRTRVQFPVQVDAPGAIGNHMISLTHNWHWDEKAGWARPLRGEPSVALTLESYFRGLAELNLDVGAPGLDPPWRGGRAMGFAARLDGSYTTLSLGGSMFNPAGTGVKLTSGTGGEPAVLLTAGAEPHRALLELRDDGDRPTVQLDSDGRLVWRARDGGVRAALEPAEGGVRIAGTVSANAVRIGASGTPLGAVHLRGVELSPEPVPAGAIVERRIAVDGIAADALVFANGPAQPPGLALAGARVAATGEIALVFVNLAAAPRRPAEGRYAIFAVQIEPN